MTDGTAAGRAELVNRPFRLREWLVEPRLNRLTRGDESIQIELKMMDVLVCLAGHAGELVERQHLIDTVWATEFISENILTRAIAELRNVLGDDAKNPSFIETIHRKGYRLIAPVEAAVPDEPTTGKVARFPVSVRHAEDERSPYPGLAAFTEEDAEFFYGRETEVSQLLRKITSRRLLAVIGPSGVGKSSLLRAGLIPAAPGGWGTLICQPAESPFASLARVLAPEFEGDPEAIAKLVDVSDEDAAFALVSRWRQLHDQALFIVDQFEELFTLNTREVQARFAGLLGRIAREADVHVLLSMRDDFHFRCHEYDALAPVFDSITPVSTPTRAALHRALVEPAAHFSFAFEDDAIVEEMLEAVVGERGALPLLAFTIARLWEGRDLEKHQLTRSACKDLGGVHGALARYAEATVAAVGSGRLAVVREIFRNLVTSEGTRATREWGELLSVFKDSEHESAEDVLRELVNSRLLTSYEERQEDGDSIRRVEIIHESLLANWPRLVRWQTQDADAAQLRDQLRQAARTWDEQGRSDDTLWTRTAFREFAVWRESYPGGLTEIEEAFSTAMVSLAQRKKRRRRMAVTAALVIATVVAAATTGLWRRSAHQELRAEAQKLIALGQVRMEDYPTAALAHATKSLELADSEEARILALEALWQGPTAFVVNEFPSINSSFSREGGWLVQTHDYSSSLAIISRDGTQRVMDHPSESGTTRVQANFGDSEDLFSSMEDNAELGRIAVWSASEGRLLAVGERLGDADYASMPVVDEDAERPRAVFAQLKRDVVSFDALYAEGDQERLGEYRMKRPFGRGGAAWLDKASGGWFAVWDENDVSILSIGDAGISDRRFLGRHEGDVLACLGDPQGRFFLTVTGSGGVKRWDPSGKLAPTSASLPPGTHPHRVLDDGSRLIAGITPEDGTNDYSMWSIWSIDESGLHFLRHFEDPTTQWGTFDLNGPWLVVRGPQPAHRLWSLRAPAGAQPILLRRGPSSYSHVPVISPDGNWIATNDRGGLALWPLAREYSAVINLVDLDPWTYGVAFAPDGRFLATSAGSELRVWPLVGEVPPVGHVVFEGQTLRDVAVSPDGEMFGAAVGSAATTVWVGRKGEEPVALQSAEELGHGTVWASFSPDGRLIAAMDSGYNKANADYHVWDVATHTEVAVFHLDGEVLGHGPGFVSDGRLLTGSTKGVVSWDVETGGHEVLVEGPVQRAAASDNGQRLLTTEMGSGEGLQDPAGSPVFHDLDAGVTTTLTSHGLHVRALELDEKGTVAVSGASDGSIRVGPVNGDEPHLLLGHDGIVLDLAIDPLGRWIASAGMDKTVRLWPMPDLSKPPLHTLPHEELIAKLKALTNIRVVRDEESPTGWKIEVDPFPGWAEVPTW